MNDWADEKNLPRELPIGSLEEIDDRDVGEVLDLTRVDVGEQQAHRLPIQLLIHTKRRLTDGFLCRGSVSLFIQSGGWLIDFYVEPMSPLPSSVVEPEPEP